MDIASIIAIIALTVTIICRTKVEIDALRVQADKSPLYTGIIVWTPKEWAEFQMLVDQQIENKSTFSTMRKQSDGQKFLFIVREK
jgi:hypothetical protein